MFHDCSPKQARGLLRTAKDTAVLKEHIVHLYNEWKSGGPIKLNKPPAPKSPRSQEPLNPVLIRHMKGVSITDAAISLGVKVARVREWLELGRLKGFRPTNGRWKITLPDLRAFMAENAELLNKSG